MREVPLAWLNFTSLIRARLGAAAGRRRRSGARRRRTGAGAATGFVRAGAVAAATADGFGLDGAGVAAPRGVTAMPPATRFTW